MSGLILALALAIPVHAAGPGPIAEDRMVVVPSEKARFVPLDPKQPDGPAIAVLHGDPDTGPSSMLLRMPRMQGPLHTHTSDYDLVVLQGRMKHWAGDQQEADAPVLEPGSYWHQPGGQVHGDSCLTDVCLMFVKWAGKRDGALAPPAARR